ncbi:MAG: hypothetical protein ACRD4O_01890 [Bryobacteraceae bacterium]
MNSFRRYAGLALVLAAVAIAQQPKTNFSGRWRMLKNQSNFASFAMPDTVVRLVEQHGVAMSVHTVETLHGKTNISDIVYYTDGRISNNTINGHSAESRTFWDGPALMVRTIEKNSKNREIEMLDRWQLSPDGQMLTTTSHITTAKGSVDLKLVSIKEKVRGR